MSRSEGDALFEAVSYPKLSRDWYSRITLPGQPVIHWGPWRTEWAAQKCIEVVRNRGYLKRVIMSKHGDIGNGDTCPLFPQHGNMLVLPESTPPRQYCPDQIHDGKPGTDGVPASRAFWPVYGFEESVLAYTARLDRAIREASPTELLDLDMEVLNGNHPKPA